MSFYGHLGMSPAKQSRYFKRLANTCEAKAVRAGQSGKPWALGNVRIWQGQMVDALKARNKVIREYLRSRAYRRSYLAKLHR